MSASDTTLNNLTAEWYNATVAGLSLSPADFQLAQGSLTVPDTTALLWTMMNQIPTESIAQYYDPSTITNFSGEYTSILGDVQDNQSPSFETEMGDNYAPFMTAWKAYAKANPTVIFANPPSSVNHAQVKFFDVWASENMDPGEATKCATLLAAGYNNAIYIGNQLIQNLDQGAEVPFTVTQPELLKQLAGGQQRSFSMSSSSGSTDLSNAWTSSQSSEGGTYFYTSTSSSDATDFTQTFASSNVTVETSFGHVATVQFDALSTGTVTDGSTQYLPWYYGAALAAAYNDPSSATWVTPSNWNTFFGPSGSLQYVSTALVVADGITQTITSDASYSTAQQTYANSQSSDNYGCWPFYVSKSSSQTTTTSTSFDQNGHMTTTVTSQPGHPIIIGVLVSSVKSLVQD